MNKKLLISILVVVAILTVWFLINASQKGPLGSGELEEAFVPNNILETSVTVISAEEANQ